MNDKKRTNLVFFFLRGLIACCLVAAPPVGNAATKKVTTVAGGYVGDGNPATSASFEAPTSVARDANGNLYVSDTNNCRIRKIAASGTISTWAGSGICGYNGDGGSARSAMLNFPTGLAFDGQGNLLVADEANSRVRKVTPSGIITTIAGNGTSGYSGDGGPATQASLAGLLGVSVGPSGNIYIADTANDVIRMVDTSGIIRTVAGNHTSGFSGDGGAATSAQLNNPRTVLADTNGNLYIADSGNARVRKVDSSRIITTYAGNGSSGNGGNGGPATSASIGFLQGLLLRAGKLYIGTNSNVWAVDSATRLITIVAGNFDGSEAFSGDGNVAHLTAFFIVWGMTFDANGNLLLVDSGNNRLRKIDSRQIVTTIAGGYVGDGGSGKAASLGGAYFVFSERIAFSPAGDLFIADTQNNRVRTVSPTGIISTLAGTGITGYTGDFGPASNATLHTPSAVAFDGEGDVFVADTGNGVIRKVDASGTITSFFPIAAVGLAVDAMGYVYAADFGTSVIWKISPSTGFATIVAGVQFQYGYNGDGIQATQASLNLPTGVTVDKAGNIYIADWSNGRIRKVDTTGIISTIAGTGSCGYSGDGGLATSATLCGPTDVALDGKGNIYIADTLNFRIRAIDNFGVINTLAGTGNVGYNGNGLPATSTNLFPNAVGVSPNGIVHVTDIDLVRMIH